ncbi:hypothetical protein ACHAPT_013433, partial [Fusarium lateritium]
MDSHGIVTWLSAITIDEPSLEEELLEEAKEAWRLAHSEGPYSSMLMIKYLLDKAD